MILLFLTLLFYGLASESPGSGPCVTLPQSPTLASFFLWAGVLHVDALRFFQVEMLPGSLIAE